MACQPQQQEQQAAPSGANHEMDDEEADVDFNLESRAQEDEASDSGPPEGFWELPQETVPEHLNRPGTWNSSLCPRCQQAEETTLHQLRECPCIP